MKRYKYIGGLVLFVSVLGLLLLFIKRYYISRTVSIIGGADGPTNFHSWKIWKLYTALYHCGNIAVNYNHSFTL